MIYTSVHNLELKKLVTIHWLWQFCFHFLSTKYYCNVFFRYIIVEELSQTTNKPRKQYMCNILPDLVCFPNDRVSGTNKKKNYLNKTETLATVQLVSVGTPHLWHEWHSNPQQSLWVLDFLWFDCWRPQVTATQPWRPMCSISDEDGCELVCVGAVEGWRKAAT